jgi:hypothetical protein
MRAEEREKASEQVLVTRHGTCFWWIGQESYAVFAMQARYTIRPQ